MGIWEKGDGGEGRGLRRGIDFRSYGWLRRYGGFLVRLLRGVGCLGGRGLLVGGSGGRGQVRGRVWESGMGGSGGRGQAWEGVRRVR